MAAPGARSAPRATPALRRGGRLLALAALSVASASGCSRAALPPAPRAPQVLTERDSGRSVVLAEGAPFDVELPSRPGTGYTWEVAGLDRSILAERESPRTEPIPPARPGGPARETFRFQATRPGAARLELAYRRPWEQEAPPAATFTLEVTVRPAGAPPGVEGAPHSR